jgi:hypothetical protein
MRNAGKAAANAFPRELVIVGSIALSIVAATALFMASIPL